ncbi:TPA: hypothetical protein ACU9T0_005592 [Burkholderia cenocepacia]|uniref:Uncharacterized protein n=1 Tax=Burkholderia contaminans TaxID=488447 RepID=A0A3N8NW14_9BURK|nr:hypothetical protein [Burkholderia contaminans]RQT03170.1 hypothetical protein DF051_38470 [Burkholderia contaminans]
MTYDPRFVVPSLWPLAIALVFFAIGGATAFYDLPLLTLSVLFVGVVFFVAGAWPLIVRRKPALDADSEQSFTAANR